MKLSKTNRLGTAPHTGKADKGETPSDPTDPRLARARETDGRVQIDGRVTSLLTNSDAIK
jgi:hypothetical protein